MADLPDIPVITNADNPRMIFDQKRDLAKALVQVCRKSSYGFVLGFLAAKTKRWLDRVRPPYKDDVDYFAATLGKEAYSLNLSYEWGCTTTALNDNKNGGVILYRSLDWPIKGMGDKLVVAKHQGRAGEYWNIAYPGFAGVLNGVAAGRFAAAINAAPIPDSGHGVIIDTILSKRKNFQQSYIPAPFLLRKVFEECSNYQQAVKTLAETPLCSPAIFTIAGTEPGEYCVIERLHDEAIIHDGRKDGFVCATNHWVNTNWPAHDRPTEPRERRAKMIAGLEEGYKGNFDWLDGVILNKRTRLAFEANARTGSLKLVGVEGSHLATKVLRIES